MVDKKLSMFYFSFFLHEQRKILVLFKITVIGPPFIIVPEDIEDGKCRQPENEILRYLRNSNPSKFFAYSKSP